jgi:hypothetical protein
VSKGGPYDVVGQTGVADHVGDRGGAGLDLGEDEA